MSWGRGARTRRQRGESDHGAYRPMGPVASPTAVDTGARCASSPDTGTQGPEPNPPPAQMDIRARPSHAPHRCRDRGDCQPAKNRDRHGAKGSGRKQGPQRSPTGLHPTATETGSPQTATAATDPATRGATHTGPGPNTRFSGQGEPEAGRKP